MEKISQIFDSIKERLSSPFFFSFIVSWLICNWQIVVALLWYDPPQDSLGHISLIKYIDGQSTNLNSLVLPFIFAAIYTFLWPIINNWIGGFQAWNLRWGNNWHLGISKGTKIPFEKYIALQDGLLVKSAQYQKLIEDESSTKISLQQLENTLNEERQQFQRLLYDSNENKRVIDNLYRIEFIEGIWNKTTKRAHDDESTEVVQFMSNSLHIPAKNIQYQLSEFLFDLTKGKIQFVLFNFNDNKTKESPDYLLSSLTYHSQNHLSGWEYSNHGRVGVEYRKPKLP